VSATEASTPTLTRRTGKTVSATQSSTASQSKLIGKLVTATSFVQGLLDTLRTGGFTPGGWVHGAAKLVTRFIGGGQSSHTEPGASASTGHGSASTSHTEADGSASVRPHATGDEEVRP
jgi:hypothetical protein